MVTFAASDLGAAECRAHAVSRRAGDVDVHRQGLRAKLEAAVAELAAGRRLADRARPAVGVHDGHLDLLRDALGVVRHRVAWRRPGATGKGQRTSACSVVEPTRRTWAGEEDRQVARVDPFVPLRLDLGGRQPAARAAARRQGRQRRERVVRLGHVGGIVLAGRRRRDGPRCDRRVEGDERRRGRREEAVGGWGSRREPERLWARVLVAADRARQGRDVGAVLVRVRVGMRVALVLAMMDLAGPARDVVEAVVQDAEPGALVRRVRVRVRGLGVRVRVGVRLLRSSPAGHVERRDGAELGPETGGREGAMGCSDRRSREARRVMGSARREGGLREGSCDGRAARGTGGGQPAVLRTTTCPCRRSPQRVEATSDGAMAKTEPLLGRAVVSRSLAPAEGRVSMARGRQSLDTSSCPGQRSGREGTHVELEPRDRAGESS